MFEPFEVKATCRDIKTFLQADNGLCTDSVLAGALRLAQDKDKVLYSIRINRMKPDELALTLIYNYLTTSLQSGSFHVHRGMLSTVGQDMLRLWRATARELVARGYSSANEYAAESVGLTEEIQAVG